MKRYCILIEGKLIEGDKIEIKQLNDLIEAENLADLMDKVRDHSRIWVIKEILAIEELMNGEWRNV